MKWEGKVAELYEEWWEAQTIEELPFWKDVALRCAQENANQPGAFRIVELCCGSGRILVPVVQHLRENLVGRAVKAIGIDFSPQMLELLRTRASSYGLDAEIQPTLLDLRLTDWTTSLRLANLVLLPFNHFALIGSTSAQEFLALGVAQLLSPGGHFVVADYNPVCRRQFDDGVKRFRRMIVNKDARRVSYYWTRSWPVDLDHRTAQVIYGLDVVEWDEESGGELRVSPLQAVMLAHYVEPEDWRRLLARLELTLVAEYGDYSFEPLTSKQRSYVFIARKNGEP
jgi:SAM-dependent methyltransferase